MVRNHFFILPIIKKIMLQIGGWVGGWGRGGGKLSFQCLRPSASLRAAGKNSENDIIFILADIYIFKDTQKS
jgi:hypothetical protein